MASSPKEGKESAAKVEGEFKEMFEPLFSVFGFESVKEEGFPTIDVFENADNVFIEAELPGIDKNRVSISITEDELVIEGEKTDDRVESERVNYICIERSFGKFRRAIEIPEAADTSRITAKYREGVLLISIPKVKEQRKRTKKIEIEHNESYPGGK